MTNKLVNQDPFSNGTEEISKERQATNRTFLKNLNFFVYNTKFLPIFAAK